MFGIIVFVTALVVILATSLIKNVTFSTRTKSLIAVIVSVVAGAVAAVIENGGFDNFEAAGLVGTILMVYAVATVIYKIILPESVDAKLEDVFYSGPKDETHVPGQFSN